MSLCSLSPRSRPLLLDLSTTALICDQRPAAIRHAVRYGHVTPASHGAPGQSHRFSPQQVLGLIVAFASGLRPRGFARVVATFSAWSLPAVYHTLAIDRDLYSEEAFEASFGPCRVPVPSSSADADWHPTPEESLFLTQMQAGFMRLRAKLLSLLGRDPNAPSPNYP